MKPYSNNPAWPNRKVDGYDDVIESGTVPGAANDYTVELAQRIVPNGTLVVTSDSDVLTIIPYGVAPGVDQAAVSLELPLIKFHPSREGESLSVEYTPGGGVMSAGVMAGVFGNSHVQNTDTGTTQSSFRIGQGGGSSSATLRFGELGLWGSSGQLSHSWSSGMSTFTFGSDTAAVQRVVATQFSGSGALLTALNASNISSGTLPAARLPTQAARRDQANTFAAAQTFDLGAIIKGLILPPVQLYANSADVNHTLTATDVVLSMGNNSGSYTINVTLPPPTVGRFVLVLNSGVLQNAPVFTAQGGALFTWSGGGFIATYTGPTTDHAMYLLYAETAIRWRVFPLT